MGEDTQGAPAGTEEVAADSLPDTGSDQAAAPDTGTPRDDSTSEEGKDKAGPARHRDEQGRFARPLEALVEADPASWNPEERRKIRTAGERNIQTEEEWQKRFGKGKTTGSPGAGSDPSKAGTQPPEKPAPVPAAPKPGSAEAHLSALVKAIHPDLDPTKPEAALRSVSELNSTLTRTTQELRTREAQQEEIAQGLISRLNKGKEGLKEVYAALNLTMPADVAAILGGPAPAPAAAAAAPAAPAATQGILEGLRDDDYVPVSSLRSAIPTLINQAVEAALAKVDGRIKPIEGTFKTVSERLAAEKVENERKETRARALKDAQFYSEYWGGFYPEEALKDSAEKIWADSVDSRGYLRTDPHPEWPKLQKIFSYRTKEFLEKDDRASSFEHHLYERFHKSGKMFELMKAREERGRQRTIEAQGKRVQPALGAGVQPQGGALNGLIVPKSEADLAKMTPQQRREFVKKVTTGKIPVA